MCRRFALSRDFETFLFNNKHLTLTHSKAFTSMGFPFKLTYPRLRKKFTMPKILFLFLLLISSYAQKMVSMEEDKSLLGLMWHSKHP